MATLEQLRSLFPGAGSDSDVIKSAAKEFGINPADIAAEIGFDINKPGFVSDVKRGTGQVIGAFGSTARDLGLPNVGKAVEGYGEDIQFRNPSQINTVKQALSSPLTTAREALGEVVPQIGSSTAFGLGGRFVGGAIGSLAGPGGTLLGQSLGAAGGAYVGNLIQEYGGIRAEQREQGIEDKKRALGTGAAAAVLDTAFGTERVVNKFLTKGSDILAREAGTSLLKNVGKQTAIGLGTEALTETGQTALERYGAYKELTGDEALNEYGLAAIKGGIGGGVIRGGLSAIAGERPIQSGNEIQQAFSQPDVSGTPTSNILPPPPPPPAPNVVTPANNPDPVARMAELEGLTKGANGRLLTDVENQEYQALKAQVANMTPPAVTGGTTDIAQQTQAAAAQNQQVQEAQQKLVNREEVFGKVATLYDPENPTSLNIFGQNIEGPRVETFGNRFATVFNTLPPHVQTLAQAITQANKAFATPEKPSPLVSFSFNANNPVTSAEKALEALGKVMTKFQIDHVQSLDEAVQILNKLSTTTKGNQLEQLNAIYEAITGQDTDGFTAAQATKAEKGAKDGKLQTTTGLGAVSVEGGAGQANDGNDENVQSSNVQSVGTGSLPAGSLGLQTGQQAGEGIRTGTGADTSVVDGNASTQVIGATNEQASQSALGGGETSGQSQQAGAANLDQQSVQDGSRTYDPRITFYSTDLSHISSERRIEIISDLLLKVLAPKQERKNTVPAATRAEILRLALLEQFRHANIAEYTGLKTDTVEKQLERMGVKLVDGEFQVIDPEFAVRIVETAAAYRSPEFPDGIGQGELSGLYNTRYEGEEQSTTSLAEELEAGEQEGKPGAKLQEELGGKEDKEGQTMGTVASAGGGQGAVDSAGVAALAKIEKLQAAVDKNPTDKKAVTALANAWTAYAKSQKARAAKGEKVVIQEFEEETDLTGESTVEEAPKEEAINEVEVAKRKKVVDEARAKAAADRKGLEVGDTVVNPKLGTGEVVSFAGNGDDTRVTVKFQSGQTKELLVKSAKLEKTNAVQKPSTAKVPVQERAEGGETVGKGNAEGGKAAGKAEVKQEAKPEEIKTPAEEWADLSKLVPEIPPYDVLTNSEKSRWDDLVRRGQANLAAAVKIIGESAQPAGTTVANEKPAATGTDGTTEAVTPKFGSDQAVVKNPYTAAELTTEIENFIRADIFDRKLVIVDSIEDLLSSRLDDLRALAKAISDKGAYGVAANGTAYLIANRISKGEGRAKFMHEVGAHLGLENLLPTVVYDKLVDQLETWAAANDGSLESKLANKARERVGYAATPTVDQRNELLAYFVEEAMLAGVDPTATAKESGPLYAWFRTLWAAFKVAVRRLGFKPEKLTAQDVVNMAYGAARLEMSGTWHGTAATYRKFNHNFMSTGEGAQAYGWGSYLAQAVGIGKGYWWNDVKRKELSGYEKSLAPYRGYTFAADVINPVDMSLEIFVGFELSKYNTPAVARRLANLGVDYVELASPDGKVTTVQVGGPPGNLMRVDTAVSNSEMLDWDASFADQPQLVRDFVKGEAATIKAMNDNGASIRIKNGEDIYKYLILKFWVANNFNGSWKNATPEQRMEVKKQSSKYLEANGIQGIRFLDANSRTPTALDRSIVFDGKKYTRDALVAQSKNARALSIDEQIPFTIMRHLLRNTVAEFRQELTSKLERHKASFIESLTEAYKAANQAPVADIKERAQGAADRSYEAKLLAWLDANESKIKIVDGSQAPLTRNLVIFNEKNIQRVGSEVSANRERMKFGIAGQRSLNNLDPAEADRLKAQLVKAKLMAAAGNGADIMWTETGWFKGVDGKWKYEIPDTNAKFKPQKTNGIEGKVKVDEFYDLEDILDHPALFKAYPQLKNYQIMFDQDLPPSNASFNSLQGKITMSGQDWADMPTLLHELQHAIQHIEGFTRGGSSASIADPYAYSSLIKFQAILEFKKQKKCS